MFDINRQTSNFNRTSVPLMDEVLVWNDYMWVVYITAQNKYFCDKMYLSGISLSIFIYN